ncbi:MAG TPA: hypothetical protein VGH99_19225 [Pseudonocardia sp.]
MLRALAGGVALSVLCQLLAMVPAALLPLAVGRAVDAVLDPSVGPGWHWVVAVLGLGLAQAVGVGVGE